MDINAILDNIEELENANTTVENVRELAFLYIVRENYKNANLTANFNKSAVVQEYNDILPRYHEYVDIKTKFQLGQVSPTLIETKIKGVCTEIYEFITTLYSCTDMKAEQDCIKEMLRKLADFDI